MLRILARCPTWLRFAALPDADFAGFPTGHGLRPMAFRPARSRVPKLSHESVGQDTSEQENHNDTLVIAEHDNTVLRPGTRSIRSLLRRRSAARFVLLVAGSQAR